MKWYWKVRIYRPNGDYYTGQFATERDLREVDVRIDFYLELTGCKMLLEGMMEKPFGNVVTIEEAFSALWKEAKV